MSWSVWPGRSSALGGLSIVDWGIGALRPGQTDQDTLPPYAVLDAIIEAYMERDLSPREIVALGHAEADVRRVVGMLKRNEYKRRQSPVGIRVSRRGFGKDWRYPITSRYTDEW